MLKKIVFVGVGVVLAISPFVVLAETTGGLSDTCTLNPSIQCLQQEILFLEGLLQQLLTGRHNPGPLSCPLYNQAQLACAVGQHVVTDPTTYDGDGCAIPHMHCVPNSSSPFTISEAPTPISQSVIAGSQGITVANVVLDASGSSEDVRVPQVMLLYTDNVNPDPSTCQAFDGTTALNTGANVVNLNTNGTGAQAVSFVFDSWLTLPHGTQKMLSIKCNIPSASIGSFSWGLTNNTSACGKGATSNADICPVVTPTSGPTMTVSSGGSLLVSTDASSPAYQVVPPGSAGVNAAAYTFHASGESVQLTKIGLLLGSSASSQDLQQVYLYDGSTLVGTVVFAGSSGLAVSTLTTPVTIPVNTDKVITIKTDISSSAHAGDLIVLWPDYAHTNTQGVGVNSGTIINATSNGLRDINGVRIFRSFPAVALVALPSTGIEDGRLIRFSISASPGGSIGIGQLWITPQLSGPTIGMGTMSVYAFSSSDFTTPAPGFAGGLLFTGSTGKVTLPQPLEIPVGQTYYFEARAPITGATNGTIVTTLSGTGFGTNDGPQAFASQGDTAFVWSPNDTTTSSFATPDWVNGRGIIGLPATGISQSRSGGVTTSGQSLYVYPTTGVAPFNATFTLTGGTTGSYLISFGDGSSASNWSPDAESNSLFIKHTYTSAGTYSVTVTTNNTCGLYSRCTSNQQVASATVVVTAGSPTAPSCNIVASPSSITQGQTVTYTWTSSGATSATLNGQSVAVNGNTNSLWLAGAGTFNQPLTVTGPGGTATCNASLNVTALPGNPTADIKANGSDGPVSVTSGSSASISWSSTNAAVCGIAPSGPSPWAGNFGLSGSKDSGPLTGSITYTLQCQGNPNTNASDSVTVNVTTPPATAGSKTFSTPGSYQFTVPTYATLTVEAYGAGGGGGTNCCDNSFAGNGSASTFNSARSAGGGQGGLNNGNNGRGCLASANGGTASGGDINTSGNSGEQGGCGSAHGGNGSGPQGGAGGSGGFGGAAGNGAFPGGGGGAYNYYTAGLGGAGGAYAKKTYTTGALTPGSSATVVVGSGGLGGSGSSGAGGQSNSDYLTGPNGGAGGNGEVMISWTAPVAPPPPPPPPPNLSSATDKNSQLASALSALEQVLQSLLAQIGR